MFKFSYFFVFIFFYFLSSLITMYKVTHLNLRNFIEKTNLIFYFGSYMLFPWKREIRAWYIHYRGEQKSVRIYLAWKERKTIRCSRGGEELRRRVPDRLRDNETNIVAFIKDEEGKEVNEGWKYKRRVWRRRR